MKLFTAVLLLAAVASAQEAPANPLVTVSKNIYAISKGDILGSMEKIPDELWSYQPTKDVRTVAQLFAHVADAQYEFCGVAAEGKSVSKDLEKTLKTKAEIVPAVKTAFAYCDDAYGKLTDTSAADMVPFFGMKITKLGAMDFNTAHTMEHYGNLVTYMRLKGIVPPSSTPPAARRRQEVAEHESMEYRSLGASGLQISVLSFGTMTLGGEGRFAAMGNVQVEEARRHVEICIEAGVNIFDTADIYSFGKSEEVLGQALGARRKDIILATKVFVALEPGINHAGLSRRHILEACEASLRRLGTDYIDLYQAHNFDSLTPLDETLRAFDDLIRAGKIRYAGCSNYSGWQLMKALSISDRLGIGRYISQQINYSLLARDAEHELVPAGIDQNAGIMAWSPLQFGLLSGKFRRGQTKPSESRLNSLDAPGTVDEERLYRIVDALAEIAARREVSIPQVALNWVMRKPGVDTVIIGARNEQQLRDNLAAATWTLTDAEVERLDEVSALPLPYPYWHQQKFAGDRNPPARHVR